MMTATAISCGGGAVSAVVGRVEEEEEESPGDQIARWRRWMSRGEIDADIAVVMSRAAAAWV
jgi:hypothetical protein